MEKLLAWGVCYVLLLIGGWRAIMKGGGRRSELLLFSVIVGYSVYLTVAGIYERTSGTINAVHFRLFEPVGQMLEYILRD